MSLFEGFDEAIAGFLGLPEGQHLGQRITALGLNDLSRPPADFEGLLCDLYRLLAENRTGRAPSKENWRTTLQTQLNPANADPEILLERAVALLAKRGLLRGWANQVPVASGLVDHKDDRRAAIDLVYLGPNEARFVELKWASDNPVYAAFELLRYGLVYVYSRVRKEEMGYGDRLLMKPERVFLFVLAPPPFYRGYALEGLRKGLDQGIRALAERELGSGLNMSFSFLAFPEGFAHPFATGEEVLRACAGEELSSDVHLSTAAHSVLLALGRLAPLGGMPPP